MKKNIYFLLLLLVSLPTWADDTNFDEMMASLEKCDIITSVVKLERNKDDVDCGVTVFHITYKQPLCHKNPDAGDINLRLALVLYNDINPETCPNLVYFGGYGLHSSWGQETAKLFDCDTSAEIADRYHASLIIPEHRYFDDSSPANCWEKLEYLNADEASQDFHAIFEALKTVFKGKWAITGISKGGVTTAMQHSFFPDDADVFVPNSAPFCNGIRDSRVYDYQINKTWGEDLRERNKLFIRGLLEDSEAMTEFTEGYMEYDPTMTEKQCIGEYYRDVMELGFSEHAYSERDSIPAIWDKNDEMRALILKNHPEVTSAILTYLYVDGGKMDATEAWKNYLPESYKSVSPRKITKKEWESDAEKEMAYFYQAALQLGYYDLDAHVLYPAEGDKGIGDEIQRLYSENVDCPLYRVGTFLKPVNYDNHALFDMVKQNTLAATKPIIFLYGEDDPWTGAAMDDEIVDGNGNVYKFILEKQHHGVSIRMSAKYGNDIWSILDNVMGVSTGIESVQNPADVLSNSACYNMYGQRVAANAKGIIIRNGKKILNK